MIDIIALIVLGYLSFQIYKSISRETAIFLEFNQTTTLKDIVLLFPMGPIVLLVSAMLTKSPIGFLFATACYLPAMIISRENSAAFDCAGTDRVSRAQDAVSKAFGAAIGGLVYVGLSFIFWLIINHAGK